MSDLSGPIDMHLIQEQRDLCSCCESVDALRAALSILETELRGTGKVLERMDKAGSWSVMVNAAELQKMEAELAAKDERIAKLEGVMSIFVDVIGSSPDASAALLSICLRLGIPLC